MYYRNANAALIVYDITSLDSFEAVAGWVQGTFLCLKEITLVFYLIDGTVRTYSTLRQNYRAGVLTSVVLLY